MSRSGRLPIEVSDALRRSLLDWNDRIGVVVRMPERFSPDELSIALRDLNAEGEQLAERNAAEHNGQMEVRFRPE